MNHIQKIFSNTLFASHSLLPKKDLKTNGR